MGTLSKAKAAAMAAAFAVEPLGPFWDDQTYMSRRWRAAVDAAEVVMEDLPRADVYRIGCNANKRNVAANKAVVAAAERRLVWLATYGGEEN